MTNLLHSPYAAPARGLLALLVDQDLTALVRTASGGRIQPVNRTEATTAVLLTCPDVSKLLSYRKLTSHLLLQYLFSQGYAPKGHVSRTQLVIAVMEIWDKQLMKNEGTSRVKEDEASPIHCSFIKQETTSLNELEVQQLQQKTQQEEPQFNHNASQIPTRVKKEEASTIHRSFIKQETTFLNELEAQQPQQQLHQEEPQLNHNASQISTHKSSASHNSLSSYENQSLAPAYHHYYSSNDGSSLNYLADNTDSTNTFSIDNCAAVAASSQCLQADIPQQKNTSVVRVMSDEFSQGFCDWFYTMLNRLQPECIRQPGDTLRPDIFCSNCKTEMYLVEGGRQEECKAEGGTECEQTIRQLLLNLKLLFTPNTEGGTQTRKSSHGMIQLFCCGTLHSGRSFIGIFEQEFGLVVSPIDKAWKIAYTKVNLKKVSNVQTPSLPPCEIFPIEM